MNIMLGLSIQS